MVGWCGTILWRRVSCIYTLNIARHPWRNILETTETLGRPFDLLNICHRVWRFSRCIIILFQQQTTHLPSCVQHQAKKAARQALAGWSHSRSVVVLHAIGKTAGELPAKIAGFWFHLQVKICKATSTQVEKWKFIQLNAFVQSNTWQTKHIRNLMLTKCCNKKKCPWDRISLGHRVESLKIDEVSKPPISHHLENSAPKLCPVWSSAGVKYASLLPPKKKKQAGNLPSWWRRIVTIDEMPVTYCYNSIQ